MVVTGIVAACLWFFPVFKVGNVVISQRDQTSEADIAAITDGLQGQNILRVDTTAVASALLGLAVGGRGPGGEEIPRHH